MRLLNDWFCLSLMSIDMLQLLVLTISPPLLLLLHLCLTAPSLGSNLLGMLRAAACVCLGRGGVA